jgi:hypothetical protein
MVSVQAYNEKQMLYHLPHIQLGSPYDVYTNDVYKRLLLKKSAAYGFIGMDRMGTVCDNSSGKILGKIKCRA